MTKLMQSENEPGRESDHSKPDPETLSTLSFPRNMRTDLGSSLQLESSWSDRLARFSKGLLAPRTFVLGFIGLAALFVLYIFFHFVPVGLWISANLSNTRVGIGILPYLCPSKYHH